MQSIEEFLNEIAKDMPDAVDSSLIKFESEVLKDLSNDLLSEEDFLRWSGNSPETRKTVLLKLLREFRLEGLVRKESLMWEAFEGQPSMIWRVTRLNEDREGSLIFFKSFGVTDAEKFLVKGGETKFVSNYKEIKEELADKRKCDITYKINNIDYSSMNEMQLRVMVLLLYSDLMLSVCKNMKIETIYNMAFEYILKGFTQSRKVLNFETVELEFV
jgi:hypothetical protein